MEREQLSLTGQRFLRYVDIPSQLDEAALKAGQHPSSPGQTKMMTLLLDDFRAFADGVGTDYKSELTTSGVLIIKISPTPGHEHAPHIGLAAHVDTYPNGVAKVEPLIHVYENGDLSLPRNNTTIRAADLETYVGRKLITSSGDSVLGADDKAGVAVIMESLYAILGDHVPHGPLTVIFFPDEESGELNVNDFPPEMMNELAMFLTVDGGKLGEVDTACYSGRTVKLTFKGADAHPGIYGDRIIPAHMMAAELVVFLSNQSTPWHKDHEGGYVYPTTITGGAEKATVTCIPRAFTERDSLLYVDFLALATGEITEKWPGASVEIEVTQAYVSTDKAITANPWCLKLLRLAAAHSDIEMHEGRVPAGTDGAMMNMYYPNLPAPNMGVGASNIHMLTEFITDEDLDRGTRWLTDLIHLATCI